MDAGLHYILVTYPLYPSLQPGIPIHEVGHALGMWHEQMRPDRDDYIQIIWDKIQSGFAGNFDAKFDSLTYDLPYDYGSIMHYSSTVSSTNFKLYVYI